MSAPRGPWRERYEVWLQATPLDGSREYAARCLECGPDQGPIRDAVAGSYMKRSPWLTEHAGTRTEAWEVAWEHEQAEHGGGA